MQIKELVMESRKIDEAPMGMLNKFGNKIASKFGNDQATGRLKSGDVANKLYSAFNQYLGQSGQEPTWPVVSKWLQSNKYPIKMAQKVVQGASAAAKIPQGPSLGQRVSGRLRQGATHVKNKINKGLDAAGDYAMSKANINMREAVSAPLDTKTLEKVFTAAAQEASRIVQQRKQGGGNGQQNTRGNLSVQQGGKSNQGDDGKLAQRVGKLEAEVAALKGAGKVAGKKKVA